MRYTVIALAALFLARPAAATPTTIDPGTSLNIVQQWIYNYRAKPDPAHVPAAVRVLFKTQTFKDPETSGIYLGFIAGAIGANPAKAEQLVSSFFSCARGRRVGDRSRHRLFRIARVEGVAEQRGPAHAGTQGHDRRLSERQAADAGRNSAGRSQAGLS